MPQQSIHIERPYDLQAPILIAGFDGWGNALNVSKAMVTYLIRKLNAKVFARFDPEPFYTYDKSRPLVHIEAGRLKQVSPPEASLHAAQTGPNENDVVILKANEPNLRWLFFATELFSLCEKMGVKRFISLGSMYDNVLHSDRIISGITSDEALLTKLKEKNVLPIDYQGPGAIHSTLLIEGKRRGIQCLSLWCHCPYYLEGTTHFGILSHLGALLSYMGGFTLDIEEIEASWKELNRQIQGLIDKNPDLEAMISGLRKAKVRGSWANMGEMGKKGEKVIQLTDFLKPT